MNFNWNNNLKWLTAFMALVYFVPMLILGDDAYFTIHDNLDSEIQYLKILKDTKTMYSSGNTIIYNTLNGIPRSAFKTGLNFTSVLFYNFSTHHAYIFNFIFSHLIAFIGMFLLLKSHFITDNEKQYVYIIGALLFAMLPYYSIYGLTVAGQPLFFWALLNIRDNKGKKYWNFTIISLMPFFILGYLISPFLMISSSIILLINWVKTRKFNWNFAMANLIFIMLCVVADYQMYTMILKNNFISHRTEWNLSEILPLNIGYIIQSMITLFFETQYHTGSMPTKTILVLFFIGISISFHDKVKLNDYLMLFASILSIVLFFGLNYLLLKYFGNKLSLLKIFQWNRFYYLLPMLWLILFTVIISRLLDFRMLNVFVFLMLTFQLIYILRKNTEVINNIKILMNRNKDIISVSEYYSEPVMQKIKQHINMSPDSYKVGCVGFDPAVASYNGIYTLDAYQNMYDVKYKHQFRKIISEDLDKNPEIKKHFDFWGSQCYLYCDEFNKTRKITNLNYDWEKFKELGGSHIISSVKLLNPDTNNIKFEAYFSDKSKKYMDAYLYKVK